MAEVPLPTPTQVPVPSTDIRNAVFAGAKLDEEVTGTGEFYTDRLGVKRLTNTGRNNQFDAAQLDRANRFEQFLLSSGYVFLGDYEDGPFQFSARNQYVRYDNQYYRLNAATDVGFTTTGTDATNFANDVTHFVLMDGDTLRQNLGSSEPGMGDDLVFTKYGISVGEYIRNSPVRLSNYKITSGTDVTTAFSEAANLAALSKKLFLVDVDCLISSVTIPGNLTIEIMPGKAISQLPGSGLKMLIAGGDNVLIKSDGTGRLIGQ
ncbi:hypothetical protein MLJ31_003338, partial [Klebsiella pneumoniae]|nr:hypothetical protein [Klebsiella pneumoniae]